MATQQHVKNQIVKAVADYFVSELPFSYTPTVGPDITVNTVDEFRKIVSGGQISNVSGSQDQQLVLYQQDYQSFDTLFDIAVEKATMCYCPHDIISDNTSNGHLCSGDYTSVDSFGSLISHTAGATYTDLRFNLTANVANNCEGAQTIPIDETVLSILAQFIPLDNQQIVIDPIQAQQVLDTNIFELMPQQTTRQQLIDEFFTDYHNLKGPTGQSPPPFSDIDSG